MIFFTLPCAPPLRPAVPVAGHASRSNKGCTKQQSLPNCQHNGRISPCDRPGNCAQGVILAERPGRNGRCKAEGQATGQRTKAYGSDTGNQQGRRTGTGKGTAGKEGQSGKERVAGKTRVTGKTRGLRKIERKNRPAKTQALRPDPRAGLTLNNYLFWSPRIRIATSRIVVSSSVTTPPSGPGSK